MRNKQYVLYDYDYIERTKSFNRCKFSMCKRVVDGRTYFDIVLDCDGFVFVLQPKEFYSPKTHFIYQKMLHALAVDKYAELPAER